MTIARLKKLARTTALFVILAAAGVVAAENVIPLGEKRPVETSEGDNQVLRRCLTPQILERESSELVRDNQWSLPKMALAADFADTINIVVLRYNFQYEQTDDPNTTGLGHMDVTTTVEEFYDSAGHFIDPPPHDSIYFDAHMKALRTYYEFVSDGKLTLTWDIYPSGIDSVWELPYPMSHYGKCDFSEVVAGLEQYFIDCIQLADTVAPEIDFGRYESIFLFHAGSDGQNDIGFPPTCNDLFTGFIRFGDSLAVDHDSNFVRTALLMPETTNQDNRATAMNAVIAHEFGHQLGLVDLYSTSTFMSMLGDFALMDNNGFGSGIDFGFEVGSVFGAIPLYPMAWSRAYLGFVDVVDYREKTDVRLVAAEMVSDGIKVARVPITEYEYYLLENRLVDIDGEPPAAKQDTLSYVLLGPTDTTHGELNGEYDFLMPGSGVLVYHVDERVAALDYDYDGVNNFQDNQLQWARDIYGNDVDQFITLVEADGFVNFGGYYRLGYGSEEDMFRDDRNHSFTPNTNPASIDNSGNNTHIFITDITRATDSSTGSLMDSVVFFDVATDMMSSGFPVRAGLPVAGISPIADDLDGDGNPEIIAASGNLLSVISADGGHFLAQYTGCDTCPVYFDIAYASVNSGVLHALHLYAIAENFISAGPVTGRFSDGSSDYRLVAVGYPTGEGATGRVDLYSLMDEDFNGLADLESGIDTSFFNTIGMPLILSFGDVLYAVTDSGVVYFKETFESAPVESFLVSDDELFGACRVGNALILAGGSDESTSLYYFNSSDSVSVTIDGRYSLGPVVGDLDLDDTPEIVMCSEDGNVVVVKFDTNSLSTPFSVADLRETGYEFTANPIVGDVDMDGYPDIVVGGVNAVCAFNYQLTLKTDFPIEINDRFPMDRVSSSPVIADLQEGGLAEIVMPTEAGNIYSYGPDRSFGFPLSAGEHASGSPVLFTDSVSGRLGYLGADGWFYLWDVDDDETSDMWPMYGADPEGTFAFDAAKLPGVKQYATSLPKERFYNYPNPVVDGSTTIRYFLGDEASSVMLTIFDMSGREITKLSGPTTGMVDNELVWDCGDVTPGVYRCRIEVEFGGNSETAFTDIAIIR
ncbi:MAG: hypothetical protein AB1483_12900 [Candidatus Zixiibacteriota bacterium]